MNTVHCNQLIQALGSKNMQDCLEVYEFMKSNKSLSPDHFTYSTLLKACTNSNDLELIKKIHNDIIKFNIEFDIYIISSLITCYSNCGDFNSAIDVFNNSKEKDIVIYNCIIDLLINNKKFDEALSLL